MSIQRYDSPDGDWLPSPDGDAVKFVDYEREVAELNALKEAWRTSVGDGTDKLTSEGIKSLVDDYRQQVAGLKAEIDLLAKALDCKNETVIELSREIERLKDTLAKREALLDKMTANNERLRAENERLKAPVSYEEWKRVVMSSKGLRSLDEFIAARAKEPKL